MLLSLYTLRRHSAREPASFRLWGQARWPILFCGPTQEPVLANTGDARESFLFCFSFLFLLKNAGIWTGGWGGGDGEGGRHQRGKKSLAVNVACIPTYWPTPDLKSITSRFSTDGTSAFCVRSSLLQGFGSDLNQTFHKYNSGQPQSLYATVRFWFFLCITNVLCHSASENGPIVISQSTQTMHPLQRLYQNMQMKDLLVS